MLDKDFKGRLDNCKKNDSSIFILTTFPYFIVGPVEYVTEDYVVVRAKFGVSDELLNTLFHINVSTIVAFN